MYHIKKKLLNFLKKIILWKGVIKTSDRELYSVNGGGIGWGIAGLIAGLVTFVIGVIDGYVRPLKCN